MCAAACNPSHVAGAALVEAITNAVYEALMAPVAVNLKALPGLKDWTAAAPGQGRGVMTGAGECVGVCWGHSRDCVCPSHIAQRQQQQQHKGRVGVS
jgi:hypothetical protein